MRRFAAVLWCGAVALAVVALLPGPAAASCAQSSVADQAGRADAVFVATPSGSGRQVEAHVTDVFKGEVPASVRIDGGPDGNSESTTFDPSTQYLVFAQGSGEDVTVEGCSGTGPVTDANLAAATDALGPPTSFRVRGGTGTDDKTSAPTPASETTSAAPSAPASADPTTDAADSDDRSHSGWVFGIVLAVLVAAAFLVPRLRRGGRS